MNPHSDFNQRLHWELENQARRQDGLAPLPPAGFSQPAQYPAAQQPPAVIDRFDRQTKDIGLGAAIGVAATLLIARLRKRGGWS